MLIIPPHADAADLARLSSMVASTRRQFVAGLGALGATQWLPSNSRAVQIASAADKNVRVDVHHHFLPPGYVASVGKDAIAVPIPNQTIPQWSPAASLEVMDRNGIATAMVSISAPGLWFGDAPRARRLARLCNEYAAGMIAGHPGRFGAFAALPLPDVKASLAEIRHALDTLRCDGMGLMTNYAGRYLGDPEFAPVFDELNRRKAVVYVHPTMCSCGFGGLPGVTDSMIEFPHDTTRTVVSLLFSGTFSRCPDIRFIFSHAGGTVPYLAARINGVSALNQKLMQQVPDGVIPTLRRQRYDTASSGNPITLGALLKFVPAGNVLLGTDFPFAPETAMQATIGGILQADLSPEDRSAIEYGNARALFSRLGRRLLPEPRAS